MRNIGYTSGDIGKNEQGIHVPINNVVQTLRAGLRYDHDFTSLPTSKSFETREVSFIIEGIQTKTLDEHVLDDCDEQTDDTNTNFILHENVATPSVEST